ncbi:hypothetical protein IGI04_015199 [Brassica rapa subsp. trilocularis]|uniref:Uncharacterized protein n=1 Tax=Brassica rapa subsp. trilocularis TaxID=1813537 RepID=A0ABQ7MPD3_BRACM|nr:hypothetical protein IGI04_015199 [Brassica rapa subsp. trilocularis]
MVFRRWDPGLCLRDWVVMGIQEHASDSQKRGFQSDHLGIILGFNKDIWVRLWKSKISMDWIGYPFGINMESWNNKGFGVWGAWMLWDFLDWRSESINLQRYGFMGKDLLQEITANRGQYKSLLEAHICSITLSSFDYNSDQKLILFSVIMTQSQLLNNNEVLKNGEGMRKKLKISVAHFDNSALIKTYSKTLIGRCMNPAEQQMKALEGNGGWFDEAKHDERARSYKGVVINGNMGQQNKEREGRQYYGKGKGKMADVQDSKWVKVAEKGHRRPYNNQGNYRGDGEGSRYKPGRDDARNDNSELGFGVQETRTGISSGQSGAVQEQRGPPKKDREEGEIKNNGEEDTRLPSREFQMELAKTQAEGTEVIVGTTDEERGLNMINGMVEKRDYTEEDLEMEIETINATLLENGDDMEEEEEFQTLSEEEAEQASRAQVLSEHALEEEKMVNGEADGEKGTGPEVGATKQGNRKRLYKPSISTAGSTKMRLASALLSPRKRAAAKMGPRQGDSSKPLESKGPSNPKLVNLKF